jgi:cytochrome c556
MRKTVLFGIAVALAVMGWSSLAVAQCGGGGGGGAGNMKQIMASMKPVTEGIVEAGSKIGEKKPNEKDVKPLQSNGAKLAGLTSQLFTCVKGDAKCAAVAQKLAKGVGDLKKNCKSKKSEGIADAISQIRATCGECHNCPGL